MLWLEQPASFIPVDRDRETSRRTGDTGPSTARLELLKKDHSSVEEHMLLSAGPNSFRSIFS